MPEPISPQDLPQILQLALTKMIEATLAQERQFHLADHPQDRANGYAPERTLHVGATPVGPQTLTVIGYQPMGRTVTQSFSVNSLSFQTFYRDPTFVNLYQVAIPNARWSLDNFVISGVPEPSAGELIILGTLGSLGWHWVRRRRA